MWCKPRPRRAMAASHDTCELFADAALEAEARIRTRFCDGTVNVTRQLTAPPVAERFVLSYQSDAATRPAALRRRSCIANVLT